MPKRTLYQNTFYHVYNRGWEKHRIFLTENDLEYFIFKMGLYREKFPNIKIVAFAVLPNHFHFLVKECEEKVVDKECCSTPGWKSETLPQFFGQLQNSYAKHFNKKYDHRGPLFEGRFCAKFVEDEEYFNQVKSYIERNAVKHEIVKDPREWPYSSYNPQTTPDGIFDESFDPGFD